MSLSAVSAVGPGDDRPISNEGDVRAFPRVYGLAGEGAAEPLGPRIVVEEAGQEVTAFAASAMALAGRAEAATAGGGCICRG